MAATKRKCALAVAVAAVGVLCFPGPEPQRHSQPSWQRFIRSPGSRVIKPQGIVAHQTTGNVTNPTGMIDGNGPTVLTCNDSDAAPTVVVDFGQNVVGRLAINFGGSHSFSGRLPGLRLAFSETMEYLKDRSDFTRSDNAAGVEKLTNGTDQIAVNSEPFRWENTHGCLYGSRQVCSDGLHGFRYLKLWLDALESDAPYTSSLGSISILSLSLEWLAYLGTVDTFTGYFECSDDRLTQWWFDGVYTVDLGTGVFRANETEPRNASSPTLEGKQALFDGMKRDRAPYTADLAIASLTSYLSHNFSESTRNVLEDLALHQRADGWIPPASINNYTLPLFDYPLWWVVCSVDFVMYTGNTSYADTYWNVLVKTLDGYYPQHTNSSTHLLVKPAEMGYGDYAFLPRSGPITYYNALYVHALSYAAGLARSLDRADEAYRWTARAAEIGSSVMEHNFDSRVGAFYDGGPCPGEPVGTYCPVHAQDGNSIAILAGITNKKVSSQILDYWARNASRPYGNAFYDSSVLSPQGRFSDRVYAFVSYFELGARLSTPGAESSAFDELRRLYGWMSSHDPNITMWEGIGPDGTAYEGSFTSMAHGWSTGIVPLMSNHILGVKPLQPGFREWQVCPVVVGGGLHWARGVVPTPNGDIKVSWKWRDIRAGTVLSLYVKAPGHTTGMICVPSFGSTKYKAQLDGKDLSSLPGAAAQDWKGGSDSARTVSVGGGSHRLTVVIY